MHRIITTTTSDASGLCACALALLAAGCGGGSGGTGGGIATPPPAIPPPVASDSPFWAQWGFNAQHGGTVTVAAQALNTQLADIIYDPFVAQEQTESGGDLIAHYPSTLVDAGDFYFMAKTGSYVACQPSGSWQTGAACGPNTWDRMVWNVVRYHWQNGAAVRIWVYASDWKPLPNGVGLSGWEPVFHPLLANGVLYVPGAAGTVWRVDKTAGTALSQIDPFAGTAVLKRNAYVSGPLTSDAAGNIYYNVIEIADASLGDPWLNDVVSAWLVRISSGNVVSSISYATLVPDAPTGTSSVCGGHFSNEPLPWPPSAAAVPPPQRCGSQRPGVNVTPAIAPDGTIYTVSRAHFSANTSYLIALNPDLTPKWRASMQRVLTDGCGVLIPIAPDTTTPNSCRPGSTMGVDPTTNDFGSAEVTDLSSSTPTALPDGSVLYGAMSRYNGLRGHLLKFSAAGAFLHSYDFGWDSTPAVYLHDGTYSIIIKDNHYALSGLYCNSFSVICGALPAGPYYITQLNANLSVEWQFQNTTVDAGSPNGYEWCINAPVVDANGTVYVNGEDGYLYAIDQGSGLLTVPRQRKFLRQAIGAAYTPLSIGADGRLYTQNAGHLFAVGN
jgi:hypothetical protein